MTSRASRPPVPPPVVAPDQAWSRPQPDGRRLSESKQRRQSDVRHEPVLFLQEADEQFAPGQVAVTARLRIPPAAARMRRAQTGGSVAAHDIRELRVYRNANREVTITSCGRWVRMNQRNTCSATATSCGPRCLACCHLPAAPVAGSSCSRRRDQAGSRPDSHRLRMASVRSRFPNLPVDGVPPVPASRDVADGTGPSDFFLAQIVLTAAIPARGIVVDGGIIGQIVALSDDQLSLVEAIPIAAADPGPHTGNRRKCSGQAMSV